MDIMTGALEWKNEVDQLQQTEINAMILQMMVQKTQVPKF